MSVNFAVISVPQEAFLDGIEAVKNKIYDEIRNIIECEWKLGNIISFSDVKTMQTPSALKIQYALEYVCVSDEQYKKEQERLEIGL